MPLPKDYEERVYAGVLGKIIGVYIGRPFEGWSYDRIVRELGEIDRYVHAEMNRSVVEVDDDISGTFTFLRALADCGEGAQVTPRDIGRAWLNYLIEERAVLWWGGLGASTEHTAYLRLKSGIPAPESGSIETNGPIIAQQIGAQIFIDGWAMVAPGDPALAAELARRAASVSHDGEAIYGAQVIAAMEAAAFTESDINTLIDTALKFIPADCDVARVIADIRKWHAEERDWRKAAKRLAEQYPYERFGGGCPMVTNHGVIILALLYGGGDFDRSMMIVNTCGWDTDCNSGNLGCLLGIRSGLAAFGGADWRGPVADRIIMPTADAGAAITDAAIEAGRIINCGRALAGAEPFAPKGGARFHFEFPGSVQGFRAEGEGAKVENVAGHSASGTRSLAVRFKSAARAVTPTFIQPQDEKFVNYRLFASPTLSPGQTLRATVWADSKNAKSITCRLTLTTCAVEGEYRPLDGDAAQLAPGESAELTWRVPEVPGAVITQAGISAAGASGGTVYLDALGWNGEPDLALSPADAPGKMWQRAWVNAADTLGFHGGSVRCGQNRGTGLAIQGTYEWADYRLTANVKTDLSAAAGLAVRVQGMRRYCALELIPGAVRLVKVYDEDEIVLASEAVDWRFGGTHALSLEARGETLKAAVDGKTLIEADDPDTRLKSGAAALIVTEGRLIADGVRVQPVGE